MKKIILIVLLALVSVAAYSQNGIISEITGDVTLRHAGSTQFTPAVVGSAVTRDTIVSTGFRSTAVITVGSNTITVRQLTRLSLSEIQSSADTENVNISLQTGRIRVDVSPPVGTRANTRVQSPSSTASVRGTSFEMDSLNLQVLHGSVVFAGNNGFQSAVSGGASSMVAGGNAVDPAVVAAAELAPAAPVGSGFSGETTAPAPVPSTHGTIIVIPDFDTQR